MKTKSGHPVSVKVLLCGCLLFTPLVLPAFDRFVALSMLETGGNDTAIGQHGEVSRFQITRSNWRRYAGNLDPANPFTALNCAAVIMAERGTRFMRAHGRPPTDREWYMLWHRPSRVHQPTRDEAERAQRFANLCRPQ